MYYSVASEPTSTLSPKASGNSVSITPISLEHRFKIRPDEFILKNCMRDRVMPRNSKSCRFREAFMHILKKIAVRWKAK